MEKKMTFNYFYGTEADQFSFYRIPKALFTDSYFKDLSSDAKILYGLMLRYLGQSAQAEITAQIYGGTCLSQIPPHDFYCHPLFRFRHFILI